MTSHDWDQLSSHALGAAGVLYFLALICHLVEWSALAGRRTAVAERELVGAGAPDAAQDDRQAAEQPRTSYDEKRELRREFSARLGILLTGIGVVIHLGALVARGMAAEPHRVPWGNMYEFTMSGTFVVVAAYVLLYRRLTLAWMAPLVLTFALIIMMIGEIWLYEPIAPLTEALNSYWLVIHVVSAILATGAFTLGGMASAMYLVKARAGDRSTGWLAHVPSLPVLDRVAYRIHAFAFPVWTFAVLITGPIWAHEAWSSYWNWDPKEVWAFITWVVYAGYLHARATAGWRGRNAAILALVGMATLWFNFIGINYFSTTSSHSYAAPVGGAVVEVRR
ncbi:MAG: c-type cytochrome biogenesis protein CcsB [Nocardioides sp.]|uniref:c-type cytochrome biogenesis protein CcsB n=1 Tax=Nocardioides sp. TaxID=35761 RepID=UPI0039E4B93E